MVLPVDLIKLVLLRLDVHIIYRLYQTSSLVRRLAFWRELIERDLGIVPKFTVDGKLHYLRSMGLPLISTVIDASGEVIQNKVLEIFGRRSFLLSNKKIQIGELTVNPPRGDKFRQMIEADDLADYLLLTDSGRVFNLGGRDEKFPKGTVKIASTIRYRYALDRDGAVYVDDVDMKLPEKAIQIVLAFQKGREHSADGLLVLSETGKVYIIHDDTGWSTYYVYELIQWMVDVDTFINFEGQLTGHRKSKLALKHLPIVSSSKQLLITKNLQLITSESQRIGNDVLKRWGIYSAIPNILQFTIYNQFRILN